MTFLTGKTALVTGASRGIGAAIVRRLAHDGARVIAHYGTSTAEAEALANETGAELVQADLSAPDGAETLAAQVAGEIDILVNNAGVASFNNWGEQSVEDFDRQYAVNVRAPLLLTQGLGTRIRDGGRIIMLSSIVGRRSFAGGAITAYAGTKGAIDAITIHLAPVFGPRHITVNAISPGAIDTDMSGWIRQEGGEAQAHAMQAIPRIGQVEDVADAVAFLASDDARWITGQTLQVGGGTLV